MRPSDRFSLLLEKNLYQDALYWAMAFSAISLVECSRFAKQTMLRRNMMILSKKNIEEEAGKQHNAGDAEQ